MTGKNQNIERDRALLAPLKTKIASAAEKRSVDARAAAIAMPLVSRGSESLILYEELRAFGIPFSRVHLRRLEAAGRFPRRVKLSERRVAWRVADIRDFLQRLATGGAADA